MRGGARDEERVGAERCRGKYWARQNQGPFISVENGFSPETHTLEVILYLCFKLVDYSPFFSSIQVLYLKGLSSKTKSGTKVVSV